MVKSSLKRTVLAALALAGAALVAPAHAAGVGTDFGAPSLATAVQQNAVTLLTFDVSGINSIGEFGDPVNQVFNLNVGANAEIVSVTWNVTVNATTPSWLSEALVFFTNSAVTEGVILSVGFGDDAPGIATYSGSLVLADEGLSFNVGSDGLLRLEFAEDFDDSSVSPDAIWTSGTLVFGVAAVPEPSSYALMAAGLLGIGVVARRRRRQD